MRAQHWISEPFISFIKRLYLTLASGILLLPLKGQYIYPNAQKSAIWADSVLKTLNFEQQIAQKLMVPAWTRNAQLSQEVIDAVTQYQVGGIIFFQGTPQTHIMALNYLQQETKIPLLIGMDAEWGPAMRLDHVPKFPYPLSIAATESSSYAFDIGYAQGKMLKSLGVHINFAPVVDLNSNPNNPIIGFRSFGNNLNLVNAQAAAFNKGLEAAGVWGCAKHFPGHGNTLADSHKELPLVSHDKKTLKRDLTPFEYAIDEGVKSIMVAHLKIPFLDDRPEMPSSLSRNIVHDLLREKMEFQGLIITDAMNMKGVSAHYRSDEAALMALQAGNDILCFVDNVPEILSKCRIWLDSNWLDSQEIAASVRRILIAKHQTSSPYLSNPEHIQAALNAEYRRFTLQQIEAPELAYEPFSKSFEEDIELASRHVCALDNKQAFRLPWKPHQRDTLFAVIFGDRIPEIFVQRLNSYQNVQYIWAQNFDRADTLLQYLNQRNGKFLFFNAEQRMWGGNSRVLPEMLYLVLAQWQSHKNAVFIHTGNVYALQQLKCEMPIILGMETGEAYLIACIDGLYGFRGIKGKLPVNLELPEANLLPRNTQAWVAPLRWADPETQGFHCDESSSLEGIMDSIVLSGAAESAQLVVLKNGHIIYDIARGKHPFGGKSVTPHTVFDIASITKIAATTLGMMHLYEQEDLDLEAPIKTYWKEAESYPWGSVKLSEFLTHRSGLPPYLPLTSKLTSNSLFIRIDSVHTPDSGDIRWGADRYLSAEISDTVWSWIQGTSPKKKAKKRDLQPYVYSDLNAIILGKFIEKRSGVSLSRFCDSVFYEPMGLFRTGFLPKEKGLNEAILPTQIDSLGERGLIWKEVHDPSAFLLGGVAGNAGVFSSAYDLSRLMWMLCEGQTVGSRFFKKETLKTFTQTYELGDNYRGLGFDKANGFPNALKDVRIKGSNLYDDAPTQIFGHAGFTGTWAWADPENQLVFVFLSNRTYPNDTQNKLAHRGYRGKLMEIVFRSLKAVDKTE